MQSTNNTRKARSTIIIGMFLINAMAAAGWAGELIFWGQDRYGAFGNTPAGNDFEAISASYTHCIAKKSDGSLVSWGLDNYGQVSNTPSGTGFKAVAAGNGHSVAIKFDGSLIAWGDDTYGQVSNTPAGTGFVTVSAGNGHSVALRDDHSLVAWGYNRYYQVSRTPTGNDFAAVSAGDMHNLALKSDGSLIAWGYDSYGQVYYTPSGNDFTAVAAGGWHNVALKSDGSLIAWGMNADNQLINAPSNNDFVHFEAGYEHGVALKSDGSLVAWGRDNYGQVGDTPTGTGFTTVAAGPYYNVAIRGTQTPPPIPTVSISAADASAGEPSNNGSFTVSRTGDTSSSLLVYYSTSGSTASAGADYAALPGYVYILAGQSSASIPVTVYDDGTVESSETVRLTISSNAAYNVGSPSSATVTITDDDVPVTPTVTITATDASAGEPSNNGSFTVSRTGDTSSNLLVYYSISGSTATSGADYAALPGYVYIYAGNSSASIPVAVIDDSTVESSETVRVTISSNAAYNIGSPSYATVTITDDDYDPPTGGNSVITITAADASAGEPSNHGYCLVSRTVDTSGSLRVYYSTAGSTASTGADYAALPGYVDFSSGQSYAVIYVIVYDDSTVESSETVKLTISSNAAYSIGSPSSATVTIADDDTAPQETSVVTITAPDASAGEPSNNGYFTVSRTGATASNLLVYYSTSGSTASPGADYASLPGYVYIPAGQYSASIPVTVYDDSTVESSETVRVTISSNAAYTIGSPSYATVTIADDDYQQPAQPVVTITAPDASAGEPSNNGYFTISRTGDTASNLLVYYSTSGSTASPGADYASLPGYVYIYAGQTSATISVGVIDDSTVESSETVRVTISSNAAYTIGSPNYATVTITDDDYQQPAQPVVTITAPDASAGEPANDGYFTVSRTGDTASNLLVYYSTSGSTASAGYDYASLPGYVYIYAGQYSASISVTVYDDSTVESSETVRLTIISNAAYTIGSPSSATVTIADDDVSTPPSPAVDMMTDTLDFFYLSVDQGYLEGVGKNKGFKDKALNSFQTMLETALRLIKEGDYNGACSQLSDALSLCDGLPNPTDYVSGQATAELADMIRDVMSELGC